MDSTIKESLIKIALNGAKKAHQEGNSPFGAVLSDMDGNVIDDAHNTVNTDMNPTAHAEINLIKKVCQKLKTKKLDNFCLISNAQSCPMCFSAAIRSGITHFIYGCAENETLVPKIDIFELSKFCNKKIIIETGILKDECERQLKQWREKTKLYRQTEQFIIKTIGKDKNDIIHAKRTVYWVKKLKPDADEALLIAAVAHDIERAIYGDRQKGQDMEKIRAHEEQSAIEIEKFLKTQNADETLIQRVKHLVICHEEGGDGDQNILNDADCLAVLEKKTCRWIAENPVEGKKRTDFVVSRIKSEKAKLIAKKYFSPVGATDR